MLDYFTVSHKTDGKTCCRIQVEPRKRQCSVVVTVDSRIVRMADETDPTFRTIGLGDWSSPALFELKAVAIAKAHSPFWRGETAR